jgi:hypothetical protein
LIDGSNKFVGCLVAAASGNIAKTDFFSVCGNENAEISVIYHKSWI